MQSSIKPLKDILYSPSQYLVPVFQRNYRWEEVNWAKLWDGILEIQQPEKRNNHFMGFLVFVPGLAEPGKHTIFHLVDGQQRLTTACVLLAAIRNTSRHCGLSELANEIHDYYLVHPLKRGDEHFRLLLKERDQDSYVAIVRGEGQASGRLAQAVEFFERKALEFADDDGSRLRMLFDTLCQRLEFMCATLETENPYNIFKSLNSTGVPLGASDLIRNFVFMHVLPARHDEFDAELWHPLEAKFENATGTLDEGDFSRFFRDFLMSSGRYVSPKDTFAAFEERYEATAFSPQELARTLLEASRRYSIISGTSRDVSDAVTGALAGLNVLESSTTYPLLLALFEKRAIGQIDSNELARAVEMLRGFILRRFICGESSRGYGQIFVRALIGADGPVVAALEAYLLERGWPDDRQFTTTFLTFPLYERGYTREILDAIERSRGHREPASLADVQVEHVMPQTLNEGWREALGPDHETIHRDWLHTVGNLTLSAYNQELWNHGFAIKRERYAQSNIVLTRELESTTTWGEDEIRQRGMRLAEEAARIWIGPQEVLLRSPTPERDAAESPARRELRIRFWRGLNDYLVAHHPDLPLADVRPTQAVRLSSGVRHIGFELSYGLRDSGVEIDVYFWREASFRLWEKLSASPKEWNELIGESWGFERVGSNFRGYMYIWKDVQNIRDEAGWAEAYSWLGNKLELLYGKVAPKLNAEMNLLGG